MFPQALNALWWQMALLVPLLVAALVLGRLIRHRPDSPRLSRFVLASVLAHVTLLFLLDLWHVTVQLVELQRIFAEEEKHPSYAGHQSHEPGQEAWEKLADLPAPEAVDSPVQRRVVEQPESASELFDLRPEVSAARAATLPAERVLVVPSRLPVTVSAASSSLPRAELAVSVRPPELPVAPPPGVAAVPDPNVAEPPRTAARTAAELPAPQRDMPAPLPAVAVHPQQPARVAPELRPQIARPTLPDRPAQPQPLAIAADAALPRPTDATAEPIPTAPVISAARSDVTLTAALAAAAPAEPRRSAPQAVVATAVREPSAAAAVAPPAVLRAPLMGQAAPLPTAPVPPLSATVGESKPEPAEQTALPRMPPRGLEVRSASGATLRGPTEATRPTLPGLRAPRPIDTPLRLHPAVTRLDRQKARGEPVQYARDDVGLSASFTLRQQDARIELVRRMGGDERSEAAVELGLHWLAAHQHPDGRWSLHQLGCQGHQCGDAGMSISDTAATGLALMAFLGAGHTHTRGNHAATVYRGVSWLMQQQRPDGDLAGPGGSQMYGHAIATIALCEICGMTGDPVLRGPAGKALQFIVAAQDPSGGWRYTPRSGGDTSVLGWQLMALKSGEMAGFGVAPAVYEQAGRWLDSVASGPRRELAGYQPGAGGTPPMTAEALLSRQYLGVPRGADRMLGGRLPALEPAELELEKLLLLVLRHPGHVPHAGRVLARLERDAARSAGGRPSERRPRPRQLAPEPAEPRHIRGTRRPPVRDRTGDPHARSLLPAPAAVSTVTGRCTSGSEEWGVRSGE
jgi:hypothetical protein